MKILRDRLRYVLVVLVFAVPMTSCDSDGVQVIRIYTSVTQGTVDAVVAAFSDENPGIAVEVFRAPTGELAARIAAEIREGGLQADVLWLSDPLSIQQYDADDLLLAWDPDDIAAVPPEYRTDSFFGTRLLNMVIITAAGLTNPPADWDELAMPDLGGSVVFPDPGFAGSAMGTLGYFALTEGYGFPYYRALKQQGAEQVGSPADVVNGVAEGRYAAGVTLDFSARAAIDKGSPIELVWPASGAIAIYSPIAVVAGSDQEDIARSFTSFVVSVDGQNAIAGTGWQPIRPDVAWSFADPAVSPDWSELFDRRADLLDDYRAIFDG